ncbi:MAG: glycosyltransferase family 2 protein [Lachnospiraceae bacterium]|nr:glycosyltransferase family 2 protein [Lachnospiraceae bacterium]
MKSDFLLSVVVPVYKEENNIVPFLERTVKVMEENDYRYEIIFCLDPSPDRSYEVICESIRMNNNIRLIQFSRRFGQPSATYAGICTCRGDACIITDVDLQDPPELMKEMVERWQKNGSNVVYAQRKTRAGETLIKKIVARSGYALINRMGDVDIPVNTGDFRLIDRVIMEELKKSKEHHGFLRGMVAFVGFKQEAILYDRDARYSGEGNYNRFFGSLRIGLNGLICYSTKPLEFVTVFGGIFSVIGGISLLYDIVQGILRLCSISIPHIPVTIVLLLLLGGINFLFIGLLGEYIGRIYEEVRERPRYIVDRMVDAENVDGSGKEWREQG